MKTLITLLFLIALAPQKASAARYMVNCDFLDCFRFGWTMTSAFPAYGLKALCNKRDCRKFGWKSIDTKGSKFSVSCLAKDCFKNGWVSVEMKKKKLKMDVVTCRKGDCLKYGWVTLGQSGAGQASCNKNDCSRHGGKAHWRGKKSSTRCMLGDCYKYGWILNIN